MPQHTSMNSVSEIFSAIRESLSHAEGYMQQGMDPDWFVESAFVQMRVFLEAAGFSEALGAVQQLETTARTNYSQAAAGEETGEPYLVWAGKLGQYLNALETVLGEPKVSTITKDVVEILRATQYSITDRKCFPHPPRGESDVHTRIEAVLRCVFPDLINKPKITKQIKNFEPDTGLPSIRTLIEYKFMGNHGDEKRIAGEVPADTRGYVSKDWDQFIYVIYETTRIKPEKQWTQLMRDCGINSNTSVVVISGEEPKSRRQRKQGQ